MQNLPATGRQFSKPMKITKDLLGPKHVGMRISASGVIRNAMDAMANREGCEVDRFMLSELERHLCELGIRFYSGNVMVVDEFLQLYALDQTRPKGPVSEPETQQPQPPADAAPSSPTVVFEAVDVTSDETYWTLGIWPTLEAAMAALDTCQEPSDFGCDEHEEYNGVCVVEIRERKIGWSGVGKTCSRTSWHLDYDEDSDTQKWHRDCSSQLHECSGCGERKPQDKFPDDPAVPGLCAVCDLLVRSEDEPLEVAHREEKQNEQDQ
jgi:hypothetical protein